MQSRLEPLSAGEDGKYIPPMNPDEILTRTAVLRRTATVLRETGYLSTQSIPSLRRPKWKMILELHRLFHLPDRTGYCFEPTAMPDFLADRFLRGKERLKTAYRLFFLNRPVPGPGCESLLGKDLLNELLEAGIAVSENDRILSTVRFVPWRNFLFLSDPDEGARRGTDFYVYLGGDSTLLTDFVHRRLEGGFKARRALDLCAGTSIQSYNMLDRSESITAAELNPRAVAYAEASRQINDIGSIEIIQSDLYENVQGSFDVIIANPPYVPMPSESVSARNMDAFGGGELGLDIPLRIMEGLGSRLNNGGYSAVLAGSPIIQGRDILRENLLPIADKHGLSIILHAWKYTNLKLDLALQREKGISHFMYCVIESRKTGRASVRTVHQRFLKRFPQLLALKFEQIISN